MQQETSSISIVVIVEGALETYSISIVVIVEGALELRFTECSMLSGLL